jgi:hypothetical protein
LFVCKYILACSFDLGRDWFVYEVYSDTLLHVTKVKAALRKAVALHAFMVMKITCLMAAGAVALIFVSLKIGISKTGLRCDLHIFSFSDTIAFARSKKDRHREKDMRPHKALGLLTFCETETSVFKICSV